jgi:hypothetical protein
MHGRLGIVLSAVTVLTFIIAPAAISGQGPNDCVSPNFKCSPTTACNNQERWQLKHRMPSVVGQAQQVSVADMLTWPDPQNIADTAVRKSTSPIDDKEKNVYSLEGDVWIAKRAPDDCDVHMEITSVDGTNTGKRIIAEIPSNEYFDKIRQVVMPKLGGSTGHLTKSFRVKITGLGFFDASHWTSKNPVGNHHGSAAVGTLWEIHPVLNLELVTP